MLSGAFGQKVWLLPWAVLWEGRPVLRSRAAVTPSGGRKALQASFIDWSLEGKGWSILGRSAWHRSSHPGCPRGFLALCQFHFRMVPQTSWAGLICSVETTVYCLFGPSVPSVRSCLKCYAIIIKYIGFYCYTSFSAFSFARFSILIRFQCFPQWSIIKI